MTEVDRVLKPGGELVFTDPMQADDCPDGVLQPVLDRIHLESLGSFVAASAAEFCDISTNAKPLDWPVNLSVIILTLLTSPNAANAVRSSSSVVLYDRLPT
jgi:ubiquinone/menaquinone biosynthesis C-methylase UbiE